MFILALAGAQDSGPDAEARDTGAVAVAGAAGGAEDAAGGSTPDWLFADVGTFSGSNSSGTIMFRVST